MTIEERAQKIMRDTGRKEVYSVGNFLFTDKGLARSHSRKSGNSVKIHIVGSEQDADLLRIYPKQPKPATEPVKDPEPATEPVNDPEPATEPEPAKEPEQTAPESKAKEPSKKGSKKK